jgi:hypothetical protein
MSDIMLHSVLQMPIDCWNDTELDKQQRRDRYVEASKRIIELEQQVAFLAQSREDWKASLQMTIDRMFVDLEKVVRERDEARQQVEELKEQ